MPWTENQQRAIKTRGKSLLVSAAAGSGKTAVLIERILRLLLEDKVEVDRLLVVTFTKAAAEEMRNRLYKSLLESIKKNGKERAFLNKQLGNLPCAAISTLHSFCISIIQKYFYVIDLDPGLRVGDETQMSILKDKAMDELLNSEYEKEDERFTILLDMFNDGRNEDRIRSLVEKIHVFLMNRSHPKEWTEASLENFSFDMEKFCKSNVYEEFVDMVEKKLISAQDELLYALNKASLVESNGKLLNILEDELSQVKSIVNNLSKDYPSFYRSLTQSNYARLSFKCEDNEVKESIVEARNKSKSIVNEIKKSIEYSHPDKVLLEMSKMLPEISYLMDLVFDYDGIYKEMKLDKRVMDFNDIEHYTLQILQSKEVRDELKEQYQYIFVDEYQDSNEIQDDIISSIMRDDNVFFVGDVKQSIYRFRLADPTLFMEKQDDFAKDDQKKKETIFLNQNFRSQKKIVDFINLVFENIMSKHVGEVNYDEKAKLYYGNNQTPLEKKVEFTLLHKDDENIDDEDLLEIDKIEAEAIYISNKIKNILKAKIFDSTIGEYRNIKYSDIVILLRTTKKWADTYYELLNSQGIPVHAESKSGYFDTLEIRLILQLLKVIDNLYQDIPIIAVMRSPIFAFSIEEIASIRLHQQKSTFYETILSYIGQHDNELSKKLSNMVQNIKEWKKQSRFMPINDFIWKLVVDTGYYYYISAMPAGGQRQANIRILIDRAKEYSQSNIKGLFNFIRLIEGIKETKKDLSSAKTVSANDDVVRIMSIHKSKGLEFPVVFIGGLGKRMNLQDLKESIILHKDLGICPNYVSLQERRYFPTILKTIAKEKIHLETLSEEMRVLYVAMTRARDYLYLVGSVKNLDQTLKKSSKRNLSLYDVSAGSSYLDWLLPIVLGEEKQEECSQLCSTEIIGLSQIYKNYLLDPLQDKINLSKYWSELEKYENIDAEVQGKLNWKYPYINSSNMPTKSTVSELNQVSLQDLTGRLKISETFNTPKFIEQKRITGIERGNTLHFILQHLDLQQIKAKVHPLAKEIEDQIHMMISNKLINDLDSLSFYVKKISAFLNSSLGKRMLGASKVYREKAFNIKKDLKDGSDDYILVQGVVDCFFLEDSRYVVIDYKSNYYADEEDKKKLIVEYSEQINLYKRAIELLTQKEIGESFLYLFHKNESVKILDELT